MNPPLPIAAASARLRQPPGRPRTRPEPELRAAIRATLTRIFLQALLRDLAEHPLTDDEIESARTWNPYPPRHRHG
jgi:hypothetical protein